MNNRFAISLLVNPFATRSSISSSRFVRVTVERVSNDCLVCIPQKWENRMREYSLPVHYWLQWSNQFFPTDIFYEIAVYADRQCLLNVESILKSCKQIMYGFPAGTRQRSSFAVSKPFRRGIMMSSSTMSGFQRSTIASNSSPSVASPTISRLLSELRMRLSPARDNSWSSAIAIRILSVGRDSNRPMEHIYDRS